MASLSEQRAAMKFCLNKNAVETVLMFKTARSGRPSTARIAKFKSLYAQTVDR